MDLWKVPYKALNHLIHDIFAVRGLWRWALRGLIAALLPVLLISLFRSPSAMGLGRPRPVGLRLSLLFWLVSMPLLLWLGTRQGMQTYYHRLLDPGGLSKLPAYALAIVSEHAFIQGLVLGLALPSAPGDRGGHLFNAEAPEARREGLLGPFGLGLPWGETGLSAWLGVPGAAWPALLASSLIFAQVHVGKDIGELLTAIPGGLGLAILTLRARSIWPGVLLHFGTALVILATMIVFS
jgi:membrane protease YdiL (CAAX protease family)